MRCEERVVRLVRRLVLVRFVRVVRRVESVCCAFTVDTPPKVRAIARPIAQLLENPIRIFSSHCAALRVQPPRAILRAEQPNRRRIPSFRLGGGGTHPRRPAASRRHFLATYCVLRPLQIEASGPPMPVALRATTIVAALATEASCVPWRP